MRKACSATWFTSSCRKSARPPRPASRSPSSRSVKAASDVYSPISGKVVEVNSDLSDKPETINEDAYGEGWMFVVELTSTPKSSNELLDPDAYAEALENEDH